MLQALCMHAQGEVIIRPFTQSDHERGPWSEMRHPGAPKPGSGLLAGVCVLGLFMPSVHSQCTAGQYDATVSGMQCTKGAKYSEAGIFISCEIKVAQNCTDSMPTGF